MIERLRNPSVVLAALCVGMLSIVSIRYVQQRFDRSDEHNAELIVRNYRSPSGRSIEQVLREQHPGAAITWRTQTLSSFFQHLRVHAELRAPGGAPLDYAFDVDLNTRSIHPGNRGGEETLRRLGSSPRP